ncbi:MAG: type II toxin-antitoxin system VapC family toxin [Candidatus Dormibacteraceae bacterium]
MESLTPVLVVDASVVVDWVSPNRNPENSCIRCFVKLMEQHVELVAPRIMWEEVGNTLLTGVRRRQWLGAEADLSFRALGQLPIRPTDNRQDVERAWELSRRYDDHSLYEMLYVALAQRTRSSFLSIDRALGRRLGQPEWLLDPDSVV